MTRLPAILALLLVVAGCGGGGAATTTDAEAELLEARAIDFAFSARRALVDTRFEALGDERLGSLVLEVCRQLPGAADPDAVVAAALEEIDAPPGAPGDDQILVEVIAAGLAEVCPDTVLAVATTGAPDASAAFVAAALPEIEAAGLGDRIGPAEMVAAGTALCDALDGGAGPEAAVLAEIVVLFGVTGESLAALSESGVLGIGETRVAGAVLAAAAAFLCPEHRSVIQGYLGSLEEVAG